MAVSLLRRLAAQPRRFAAAVCAGLAVFSALHVLHPSPPVTRAVWVTARDLPGGAPLTSRDVKAERLPLALLPRGSLPAAAPIVGRLLAAPMRAGEPMTDVRLLEPSLLAALGQPGLVAVPIRLADGPAAAALTRAGDLVDVLGTTGADDTSTSAALSTRVVAAGLTVLAVPARDDGSGDGAGLVVVAATDAQAARLADAATTARLSLALLRR
jgi:Flp pilus assembly protein CpaB